MECSMQAEWGNEYKLAHMNKDQLRKTVKLPVAMPCSEDTINAAREALNQV